MAETTRPIAKLSNLGSKWFELADEARRRRQKAIAENAARLKAKYGECLTDDDIVQIVKLEAQIQCCKTCEGLPCSKDRFKCMTPRIIESPNPEERPMLIFEVCRYEYLRQEQVRMSELFKSAGVSTIYASKGFKDYEVDKFNQQAVKVAQDLINGKGTGAYFYGPFGAGKTYLAALIANAFVRRGKPVIFYKVPFLIRDLLEALFNKSSEVNLETQLLNKLSKVPVLILDDFGMGEKFSTYSTGRLAMIVDARYENKDLVTVVTSNYKPELLRDRLDNPPDLKTPTYDGSRIVDRFSEMCPPVLLGGESRRKKVVQ